MGSKVCVDPGHVGFDSGNVNFGLKEKEVTLPTAHAFRETLERSGVRVVMTRIDDTKVANTLDEDLSGRADIANQNDVDLFVSWHTDSFPQNPDAKGVAIWVYPGAKGTETENIAQRIVDAIAAATGQVNRGVKYADYAVLVQTNMPAVLIEAGFASNPEENKKLADLAFQRLQAEAAARAVCEYFNVPYMLPAETDWQEHPFAEQISRVINAGIMRGYDDTHFGPDDNLTRGQATVLVCRLLDYIKEAK